MYRERVDEGDPIAYKVLEGGVPVLSSTTASSAGYTTWWRRAEKDIFHGLVIAAGHDRRFVAAADVAALHEHGVDLRIDAAAAQQLPAAGWRCARVRRGSLDDGQVEPLAQPPDIRKDWHRED